MREESVELLSLEEVELLLSRPGGAELLWGMLRDLATQRDLLATRVYELESIIDRKARGFME